MVSMAGLGSLSVQSLVNTALKLVNQTCHDPVSMRHQVHKQYRRDARLAINPLNLQSVCCSPEFERYQNARTHLLLTMPDHMMLPFLLFPTTSSRFSTPAKPWLMGVSTGNSGVKPMRTSSPE